MNWYVSVWSAVILFLTVNQLAKRVNGLEDTMMILQNNSVSHPNRRSCIIVKFLLILRDCAQFLIGDSSKF